MKIGFFDSGIGGVSVLAEAMEMLPDQDYLFYADVDHVPYGEKTEEEIAHYATENARFLLSEGAQAIVVACNTATAVAIRALREEMPVPVIGMEPAVKPAVELVEHSGDTGESRKRVLVAATPVTLRESKLRDLIDRVDRMHRVDLIPLPGLVMLAEKEQFDDAETDRYLTEALSDVDPSAYSAFVMGCTHFTYFRPLFRRHFGEAVSLIDGNAGTVRRLADVLGLRPAAPERSADSMKVGSVSWYLSGRRVTDEEKIAYFGRLLRRTQEIRNI
ncbi:MAG: glutamate racemase [Lachnospiraceae bacterium]|nr:glutamate racemase [Lachnospiraceae bacterium]